MNRLLATASAFLVVVGCSTNRPVRVEYKEVVKPVVICPAPVEVNEPHLAVWDLTDADVEDYGKVVRAYRASLLQLDGYATQLNIELDKYRKASELYEEIKTRVEGKFAK